MEKKYPKVINFCGIDLCGIINSSKIKLHFISLAVLFIILYWPLKRYTLIRGVIIWCYTVRDTGIKLTWYCKNEKKWNVPTFFIDKVFHVFMCYVRKSLNCKYGKYSTPTHPNTFVHLCCPFQDCPWLFKNSAYIMWSIICLQPVWFLLLQGKFSDGGAKVSFLCKKTFSEKENIHSSRE